MLPSEDEDGDTESVNLRERCALCRLSRDSLLGQGQLVQCRSPNNHVIKKQKSKHGGDSIKAENCLEKSILTSNNNKPRWNNHIPDFDDGKGELAIIGFPETPKLEDLVDDQGCLVVHHCCAAWSDGVLQDNNLEFLNVDKAVHNGSKQKCDFCNRFGASIGCRVPKCMKYYHYPCAAAAGTLQILSDSDMSLLCVDHLAHAKPSEVLCAVCKSMGDCQDQMFCTICGNHYHSKCLQTSINPSPELRAGWQCPDCKQCQTCGMSTNGSKMLVCDSCDKGFHTYCLRPMLSTLPKQNWKCSNCRLCDDCGATVPGPSPTSKWHLNYTLCDQCFNQRNKGEFCPVCCRAHESYVEVAMLSCTSCLRAVHGECETNADSLMQNCRNNYLCPYCRNEVSLVDVILTEEQRDLIKNNSRSSIDVECAQSNNSDDNSSGLSTPTEISVKSDDSNGTFSGKPEPREDLSPSIAVKPLHNSFLPPIIHAGKKKSSKPGYPVEKSRPKKKGNGSGVSKRSLGRSNSITALGLPDGDIMKDDDDDATNYSNVVIYGTNDKFVSEQDVCYSCGSFGKNTEGKMIACAQCGQAYHLYCTNLNMSKEGLKKVIESGWRCLDCTVCNSCGNANDEARLLLCDDCDISYHTYCLEPPLDTVPIGGWKCKWCVHCTKCSANTPGTNCNWLSNYTECGPCHSLATCPVCSQRYADEDLLACCGTCQRWLHARCDNMSSESELEWTVSKSYQCILCRPKLKSFGSGGGDGSEREQVYDGVQLSESGAQHIKSINNFVTNQFKRRHSTRAATGIGNSRPPRNKSQRSLTDKPDYSYDYSDDEFLSDSEIPPQNDSKRRPKIKSNMGKLLSKPGKQGKLMKSKSSYDGRISEPLTYESLVSTCETDMQASSLAQETFFGKSLLEMAVKDEKSTSSANEGHSDVLDDKKLDKAANDDLLINDDELNLPVDDFLYDIFMSNDHDQFSALAEDDIPQNSGMQTSNQQPMMNERSSAIDPAGPNVFTPHTDSSAVEEAVKLRAELSGETNNACSTLPVPSVTNKTLAAPPPPQSHQQQVLAMPNNVNCLPNNDSAVLTHANGNQHSVAPPVHHMNSAHSQNSIDTIEIHPRPADSAQFGVYPNQVQNHNTAPNLFDVDGLLNCGGPTGYLNVVDSLPQIDSQDVDDILAMGDLDTERPSDTPILQQPTQQPQQNQNAPPPPPTQPPSVTMGSNSMQPYQQTSMMNHSANPPPPPPPPRLQTNTFAVNEWNATPTPPVKVVPSPVAAAVTNGPKSVAPSESGSSETRESEESKNYKRYEADEHLGENARIAAVLYSIKRHPNLKEDYPETNARMKQIHKLWRKASQADKTLIAQMAKDNRAMQRSNKKKKSSPASKEGKLAVSSKSSSNPGAGTSSMEQPLQHVEMVQQLAHQQQFIEQHIQQTGSLSTFPPSNASQLSDVERPMQNFTPSKQQNYSPGKVSNPGSLMDERATSSQRSVLQQPQSVAGDSQNLSDSESGKHRQSVPSSCSEQFNNSPMGDVSGGSFSQQHSPALSQGSMPKNSPFVQSPQMPPPSQRQLSFNEACKVNPPSGGSSTNHSGPPSDASSSVSPAQAQATSNNPSAISPHAAMYRQPPPMTIRQMRPTAVHNPQFYAGPHGATGYVMQPGTAGGPYYYQGRAYTRWTSPEMMGPGAAAQWGPAPMHYPGAAGKTYVVRQPMFAHYRGQGPPMGHAQYVHPVQHWPMSARNVSGSPHYAEMFPTGPPQAMRMQPQHYGSPSAAPAVPYQRSNSGVPMPAGPLRSPSSSAGPHSHAMASPNDKQMMNTTSMDASVQQKPKTAVPVLSEPETFEFDFYQPPSVQNEMGFDRYADEDNSASARSQSATPGRSSSRQDFANIPSTSSMCDNLGDISLEPIIASSSKESLDFDQLEASFREAVKDRPPGSTAPLMMEGRTLNQAAALAVADVVDQLSANYQAQESSSSNAINTSIGGVVGSSSNARTSASSNQDTAARNNTKLSREDQQISSGFPGSRNSSQSDKELINKSRLVSEQPLLIEDLLEQERNELNRNQISTSAVTMQSPSSQSTTSNVGSKSSVKSELSPAFPHSEMLQRMAVSNRTNPPMPVFPAQVSPLGQPPMVHMYSPTVIQSGHMSQHRYAASMQLYSPTQIGQKLENPPRYGQATGTMVLDPSLQSPVQTSDPMAMSLFSRQMSQPSMSSETYQDDILTSKLKKAESELETLRRSRKSLTSKQRTLKKTGGDLLESERKALDKFSSDISAKAKEVDSIKKKIRNAAESANEMMQNESAQRMQSGSVMGPPQHPSSTSIYQSGKTPSSLTNNNPQSSPRLKRASHSIDISTTGPNSQLVNLIAKNESNQRAPHDAFSMTSNENSNQSCFEPEYGLITGDLQSSMLEPSAKRRRVKQEDQSSHSSVMSQDHQRMLSNSDQNQFPEAFLDPTNSGEDVATQDTLLSAIKQMQEMKPQEPDLKIEWTLISPKIPWNVEPSESGSLTGQFGKGSIPGRKDYYSAFLNKEPLPSSESPSPSSANSRPSSPSQRSSTNEKITESTLEKDQISSSDESRYRTDSGITSASLAEELDDDTSIKTELEFLGKIDPAAKRPTGAMSPLLESDWFVQNSIVKAESVETSENGGTVPELEIPQESSLSHKRFLSDSAALQAIQNQSVMEVSLAVRNTTGHISDIQNLIRRLAQMLCVGPLDDYSLKNLSKENRLQISTDGVLELHLNGSDVLAPNPSYFNGRDAKMAKRSPNIGASTGSKVCTTCKTPLTQNFIVKNINEVIPQKSEELPFCSNDCFFQLAILMKRSQNRHGKGSKNFDGLSVLDFKDLEMKLRPESEGEPGSNALKIKRWENIRWKRFKKPESNVNNTSMQTASQQPSTSSVTETQVEEQLTTNTIEDSTDVASPKQGTPTTVTTVTTTNTPTHPQNIVLKEEIVKMIDEIDVCLTCDHTLDERKCLFCHQIGDGKPNGPGRLLNYDCDQWVHLNCALWSEEVYETTNGALINVQAAFVRGQEQECSRCGHYGATVACHKTKCPMEYHFPCALLVGCMFFVDKTVLCPQHKYRTKTETVLENFEALRRVFIHRDEHEIIARVVEQTERKYTFRCGSTELTNIGQLFPHQMNSFHTPNAIYPVGFKTSRFYWSLDDVNKRCKYTCSIQDQDGKPHFAVSCPKATQTEAQSEVKDLSEESKSDEVNKSACKNEMELFKGTTPKEPWKMIMETVNKLRLSSASSLKLFSEVCSGEEMFGLNDVQILKILESFPSIELCRNYNFKFGRSSLVHLPLAINPSGCCRSEPKLRSYIKRPHVLTSSPKGPRSSIPSLAFNFETEGVAYSKQFVHTKSSQYKRMKQEWRNLCHLSRSRIQGLGMYSSRDVDKGTMIIEYIGLLIRSEVAEVREKQYDRMNRGIYMFRLDDDWVIDATIHGGPARFINHSCDPNCQAELVVFDKAGGVDKKEKRIIITSIRRITKGEELTYDYKIDFENDDKIPCNCGSSICRKWMN